MTRRKAFRSALSRFKNTRGLAKDFAERQGAGKANYSRKVQQSHGATYGGLIVDSPPTEDPPARRGEAKECTGPFSSAHDCAIHRPQPTAQEAEQDWAVVHAEWAEDSVIHDFACIHTCKDARERGRAEGERDAFAVSAECTRLHEENARLSETVGQLCDELDALEGRIRVALEKK